MTQTQSPERPGGLQTKLVVAIVQARMGASRLPNKMMLWMHGLPIAGWVFHRVRQAKRINRIVFALPDTAADDVLAEYLQSEGATVFRGAEQDVLGRLFAAASTFDADTVVRVCADNPFVAGSEIDRLIDVFESQGYDYAYNHIPRNNCYPDGLGAEVTRFDVLQALHRAAKLPDQREHVFNYLWAHPERFRIGTCNPADTALAHPELKLDLDTWNDYQQLLRMDVRPESSAHAVVESALTHTRREY